MRKSFTTCKECIFTIIGTTWVIRKSFLNVMIGDFVAVPTKFANIIRVQLSEVVKLEVPNGKKYGIQVAKEQNELVLRSGWETFARDYELEQRDILVFRYSGSSHFKVRIFLIELVRNFIPVGLKVRTFFDRKC